MADTDKSKNKKALLAELQGGGSPQTKRSRGPVELDKGLIDEKEGGHGTEILIDFSYKVDNENYTVSFYNKSEGDNLSLIWDFGNGESFEGETPDKIDYNGPGKYKAILTDQNSGESKEKSFSIKGPESEKGSDDSSTINKGLKSKSLESIEGFLELSRKHEFSYTGTNCRLDKKVHHILSQLTLGGKAGIADLNNYIVLKFIEENRGEIKKYIDKINDLEF